MECTAEQRRACLREQGYKQAIEDIWAVYGTEMRKRENALLETKPLPNGTHAVTGEKPAKRPPKK